MANRDSYIALLKSIGKDLQSAEEKLLELGYNTPIEFPELENFEKIPFPTGYIRTINEFEKKYKLSKFIPNETDRKNICYSLQCLDVYSYFINRFNISLSAGKIFLKLGILNVFIIIEGLLFLSAKHLNDFCLVSGSVCRKSDKCDWYIRKSNNYSFEQLIDKLSNREIVKLKKGSKEKLMNFKDIRDNVHLHLVNSTEYSANKYSIAQYNEMVSFLIYLRENLSDNISKFENNRIKNCKNVTSTV